MFMRTTVSSISVSLAILAYAATASATPEPNVYDNGNRWEIRAYRDESNVHAGPVITERICFLPYAPFGTGIQGSWFSPSIPGWQGRYYQEGDEVKMTGDLSNGQVHTQMTLVHTTVDLPGRFPGGMAFKDLTYWVTNPRFGSAGWLNATIQRRGFCHPVPPPTQVDERELAEIEASALEYIRSLPPRLTQDGRPASSPFQADIEPLEDYLQRTGQAERE